LGGNNAQFRVDGVVEVSRFIVASR
jgi:hypothetical protein